MNRLLFTLAVLLAVSVACAQTLPLVVDGQPQSRIVISRDATDQVKQAANVLAQYVEQATGAKLEVVADDQPMDYKGALLFVGSVGSVGSVKQDAEPTRVDEDGFTIRAKDNEVAICGPTDWGTEFGVYEFLERYVGVRWLLPGPDGDDVPTSKTLSIPVGTVTGQPAVFSRLFSGLQGAPQTKWARFNRMHGRVSFHHNLLHLLPPETYTKTHPEFFPMKDGKTRYLPPTNDTHAWQPCFTAPGLVDEAVKNIVRYFDEHPEETSYSLGTNDSSGYCACPQCLARISGEKNFLGLTDYSDLYYDWCNQVIEGVLKVHPDKWFGCLAYSEVAAPPKAVKVHERLLPYMTYDRMKWINSEVRAAGHEATEAWQKVSPTVGWYDYIYGTPYCLPRVYFHETQDYLRYGNAHGVRACYAESYPNWGEGPKPYVHLRLWWDSKQDVDALLKDWYERCVGPEAAPYLAQYYGLWERFWTKDILDSKWFSVGGQYLNFSSPGYLADVREEDLVTSRQLLDTCLEKCRTDKQRARAKLLETAFQYYEASAWAYLADRQIPPVIETEAQALAALNNAERAMRMAARRRHLALDVFPNDPVLVNPLSLDRFPALAGETWGGNGLWAVMDWVAKGDNAVRKRVAELASVAAPAQGVDATGLAPAATPVAAPTQRALQGADPSVASAATATEHVRDQASLMLAIVDGKITPLSKNPSFEEGEGAVSPNWSYWLKPDEGPEKPIGRMLRVEEQAHAGKFSLLCDGMLRGGPVQTIKPLPPGKYCAFAWVYVPKGTESKGTCELVVTPRGADGANLPGLSTKVTPRPGEWTLLVTGGKIEKEINGKEITQALMIPIVDGFQDGTKVYFDEVALYQVEEAG